MFNIQPQTINHFHQININYEVNIVPKPKTILERIRLFEDQQSDLSLYSFIEWFVWKAVILISIEMIMLTMMFSVGNPKIDIFKLLENL